MEWIFLPTGLLKDFSRSRSLRWQSDARFLYDSCTCRVSERLCTGTLVITAVFPQTELVHCFEDKKALEYVLFVAVAQPGAVSPPLPRNWVHKKIFGCAVELNTQIVHGLAAKYP